MELNKKDRNGHTRIPHYLLDGYVRYLKPVGFAVYCVIRSHAYYGKDFSFPGHELIAEKIGVSTRTVVRTIIRLGRLGVISKSRRRLGGKWQKNVYHINPPKLWHVPSVKMTHGENVVGLPKPGAILDKNRTPTWHSKKINFKKETLSITEVMGNMDSPWHQKYPPISNGP